MSIHIVGYVPKPVIETEMGVGERLGPGESRRMLADVAGLFVGVMEAEYRVRFSYVWQRASHPAPPVTLRFRKPAAAESALQAAAAPDRAQFPNWSTWIFTRPRQPLYAGAIQPENPLKLDLLLRQLFYGAEPPEHIDPAILDVLTVLYSPARAALKAELHRSRGDEEAYEQIRAGIRSDTPGLE